MPSESKGTLAAAGRPALHPPLVVDELVPGSIISGRFRLRKLLGRGGMASVWQAVHLTLETDIAIKFLEPRWSGSNDVRSRFAREATAIARIRSPHVVQVLDYGFTERGRGFIVMELLQGEDLGRRLARTPKLELADALRIVGQACRGLGKAHAAHIVHRDIKPENLFLVADDEGFFVKLLDFGVAKAIGVLGDATQHTDTGQLVGTPLYMSPEQALGRSVDSRCDLYSLATVAYRGLTGRPPFVAKHVGELLVAISTAVPPPPSAFEPSLPSSLDAWFASMFAKDPNARCCQTVRELAASFEDACNGTSPTSSALMATTHVSGEAPTQPGDRDGRPRSDGTPSPGLERPPRDSARARRGRAWVALTFAAVVLGLGALAVWGRGRPTVARTTRSLQAIVAAGVRTSGESVEAAAPVNDLSQVLADASMGEDVVGAGTHADAAAGASQQARVPGMPYTLGASGGSGANREPTHGSSVPPDSSTSMPTSAPKSHGGERAQEGRASAKVKPTVPPSERARAQPEGAQRVQAPTLEERPARKRALELDRTSPWRTP